MLTYQCCVALSVNKEDREVYNYGLRCLKALTTAVHLQTSPQFLITKTWCNIVDQHGIILE